MAFKTLSGFLESLFYMLFLEGHFVNVLEFANVHQFDRFGSFFELFFRFGFCNFSSFAFGTNCTTHVNSS